MQLQLYYECMKLNGYQVRMRVVWQKCLAEGLFEQWQQLFVVGNVLDMNLFVEATQVSGSPLKFVVDIFFSRWLLCVVEVGM